MNGPLTGASPSRSNTSVLLPGSLKLCGTWGTAGTDPRSFSRLGGKKVESAGSFVNLPFSALLYQKV